MIVGGLHVIAAVGAGEDLRPRHHVRVGALIVARTLEGKTCPLQIRTQEHIETFYRAAGIDYWTQDVDWQ